jgi:hypothetical protein
MEPITDLYLFLISVVFISLSGVMMPGPVFAVTVIKGYRSKKAGVLIALGHGIVEFPLIFLLYFGLSGFFASTVVQKVIGIVGGSMLVYMGFQTFKTRKKEVAHGDKAVWTHIPRCRFGCNQCKPILFRLVGNCGRSTHLERFYLRRIGIVSFRHCSLAMRPCMGHFCLLDSF